MISPARCEIWSGSLQNCTLASVPSANEPSFTQVPDGKAIFEIGSVTTVFTSLALAQMAQYNLVRLDDPVERYCQTPCAPLQSS